MYGSMDGWVDGWLDGWMEFLAEQFNPAFDPNKVLLRRVCFINDENSKYVSVGFYPAKNYQPLVEFGDAKILPITLTDQRVKQWRII
jgi:hypothetical protein